MFSPGHVIFLANVSKYTAHVWYELYYQKKQMDLCQEWSRTQMECSFSSNTPILGGVATFWAIRKKTEIGRYLQILPICVQYIHVYFTCVSDVFPNRYQCLYPWVSPRVTSRCVSRILENPESTSVPVHKLLAHFGGGSVLLGTGWSFFFPGNVPIGTR